MRSLKSVEKDGRPYSDTMDELMWKALRVEQNPKILYHLTNLRLIRATNEDDVFKYQCESHGELVVAGVTNPIATPILVQPLDRHRLKISGRTSLKMSSFRIDPPAPKTALGLIETGDDVGLLFDWVVGPTPVSSLQKQSGRDLACP